MTELWDLATGVAENEGMEVVDIEFRREGRRGGRVLRIYLDRTGGVNIDELSHVSRRLSDLLDSRDLIDGAYTLEVSSPGVNRPLKKPEHFARYVGKRIRVRAREPIEGRRSFLGILKSVGGERIEVLQEGKAYTIPFELIEKSNYEHDWSGSYAARSQSSH
ncbi:MAG TPA: ribosome maturation factor RimP [candidate division Zixibacteria bacterium]|nr:ribosome maturation factor RimP [candidate division Zixibacteria bacterium]